MVKKWLKKLDLEEWSINTKAIDPESVVYDKDIPKDDRYFVGIMSQEEALCATIFHDRALSEEDIVHELLHVKYPDWSEDQVNKETEKLIKPKQR